MKEKIDHFIAMLPTLTKEETDLIEVVIGWDSETQAAFIFAKKIFEDKDGH